MRKNYLVLLLCLLGFSTLSYGQTMTERIIYTTDFQDWSSTSYTSTPNVISKQTIQGAPLSFSLLQARVDPTKVDAAKFTNAVCTPGAIQTEKSADAYIELSPLASVTKLSFVQAATGGTRGLTLKVKGDGDADWVYLYNETINPAQGQLLEFDVNRTNVSIRFENFNSGQNGYLLSLELSGMVQVSGDQVNLTTAVSPENAGTVTVNPPGGEYNKDTQITLTAEKAFGYKFVNWVDAEGTQLSTENPYTLTLSKSMDVKAVFEAVNTYSLDWTVNGGHSFLVTASPAGTMVNDKRMYEDGTTVQLTATSNKIVSFTTWEDNTTTTLRTVTMDQDRSLTANYSVADFIVGWDMLMDDPNGERTADFYADEENQGKLSIRKADGTTGTWLKKGVAAGGYEGRYSAVNWNAFSTSDNYYYEISFATTNFTDVKVDAAMLYNYNAFTIQKVEYSLDGTNYTEIGNYELAANKVWYDKSFALPEAAWKQPKVYVRFIPDYTSPVAGTSSANDGTCITDIYVTGESFTPDDSTPPVLQSFVPNNNAQGIASSGKIILTFDERIATGTGKATLNGEELDMEINGYSAFFNYANLAYNTDYTFVLPAGAIIDRSGNSYEGTTIAFKTMDRPTVTPALFDYVVKAGDAEDFKAALKAANAAPGANRYRIFVPAGDYNLGADCLTPISRSNVSLIGEDMDKTIIRNKPQTEGISVTATILIASNVSDTYMQDITLKSDYEYTNTTGRAVVLQDRGNKTILKNVKMLSYQDTYYSNNNNMRSYMEDCAIHGVVDFICGGGDVFFNRSLIYIEARSGGGNVITAPQGTNYGYVFSDCTIDGAAKNNNDYYLGRPWGATPKTVFLNTTMKIIPAPAGWTDMTGLPLLFAEYNSRSASGVLVDASSRKKSYEVEIGRDENDKKITEPRAYTGPNVLSTEQASQYTIANVVGGTDNWAPQLATEQANAPVVTIADNTLSWANDEFALCYIVVKDGVFVAQTKENSMVVDKNGQYTVYAANEMGGLSAASNVVDVTSTAIEDVTAEEENLPVNVYSIDGRIILQNVLYNDAVQQLPKGMYIVGKTKVIITK